MTVVMDYRSVVLLICAVALSLTMGCQEEDSDSETVIEASTTEVSDAGDQAWVKRVVPLLWGRRPLSIREVFVLTQMTEQLGRKQMIQIMTRSAEYRSRWGLFFKDSLGVARVGFSANAGCYGRRVRPMVTTEVAEHIIAAKPDGPGLNPTFTMADVIDSSLLLDDVSAIYTANLFADLYMHIDDMHLLASLAQRRNRAQGFMSHYLHRRMTCLGCHNSEFSVTQDRTWPLGGYLEKSLFGVSGGRDIMSLIRFFRRKGVRAGYYYTHDDESSDDELLAKEESQSVRPWGWDLTCGRYLPPGKVHEDDYEPDQPEWGAFFVEDVGAKASIWTLQERLRSGFEALRGRAVQSTPTGPSLDGNTAFALLVSMNVADQVWREAMGSRLTIANYFPRNQAQRDLLADLTTQFVENGFSLVSLLTTVTLHPYFNGALPGDKEPLARPYSAVFDPFVEEDKAPENRRNALGDTIFRSGARTLINSVYTALGWPSPPEYLLYFLSPSARLQRSTGVFLKSGDAGFGGTSFQSALSWESNFGACSDRSSDMTCPLIPILDSPEEQGVLATTCELCLNKDAACDWDARCCDVNWDLYCDEECDTGDPAIVDLSVFPNPEPPEEGDWIKALVEHAATRDGATLKLVVEALKDRLLNEPHIENEDEAAFIEAVAGQPLSSLVDGDSEIEERLRRVCGVFTAAPQFLLMGYPSDDVRLGTTSLEVPGTQFKDFCNDLSTALFDAGAVQCGEHTLFIATDD